ncbi:MAG: biotin/lipoyl-binding protein [Nitrospira sp.]|nr:biotin/lipoyl-binding protein [Nitrospira sp.]
MDITRSGSQTATNMDLHRRDGCSDGCAVRPLVGSNHPPGGVGVDAHATIYAPAPGRIVELTLAEGRHVEKGTGLMTLESPVLEKRWR